MTQSAIRAHGYPRLLASRRLAVAILVAVTATLVQARPAASAAGGSVAVGATGSWSCFLSANCLAFLVGGCRPELAVAENGISSSIVNVAATGDAGSRRTLRGLSIAAGHLGVMFLTSTCLIVEPDPPLSVTLNPNLAHTFTLPANAKWMAVSVSDAVGYRWTLTEPTS